MARNAKNPKTRPARKADRGALDSLAAGKGKPPAVRQESAGRGGRPRKYAQGEGAERVATYLPPELAERLRVYVARQRPRRSLTDVVGDAIRDYLEKNDR